MSIRDQFKKWQQEGKYPFLVQPAARLYKFSRQLRDVSKLARVLRRLRETENVRDADQLVSLTFRDFDGLLKPLQVESEFRQMICRAAAVKAQRIVEIGTANGATLFALTRTAADDATVVSVDLPGGLYGGGYAAWKKTYYRRFAVARQKLHLIRANSHAKSTYEKVRQIVGERLVDILYIDADHSYDGVSADYQQYRNLVRPGGLIIFHDVIENTVDRTVQVDRFWQELKASGQLANIEEYVESYTQGGYGIGVGELVA